MKWTKQGEPENLEAAAADALLWLDLLDTMAGLGRVKFIDPDTRVALGNARLNLERQLPPNARTERVK